MTVGGGFRLGGTPIDRAGGILRLVAIADALVGTRWSTRIIDTGREYRLVVDAFPESVSKEAEYVSVSPREHPLIEVAIGKSNAIRDDQFDQLVGDERELEAILRGETKRRTFARLPESEKRLLDGNR